MTAHTSVKTSDKMEVVVLAAAPDGPATGATAGPMCVFVPYLVRIRAYPCISMCVFVRIHVRIRAYPRVSVRIRVRIWCVFWRIRCVFMRICYECAYGTLHPRRLTLSGSVAGLRVQTLSSTECRVCSIGHIAPLPTP